MAVESPPSRWPRAKLQALYQHIPSCLVCPQRKNIYSKNMNKFGKVYLSLSVSESFIGNTLLEIILDILTFILSKVGIGSLCGTRYNISILHMAVDQVDLYQGQEWGGCCRVIQIHQRGPLVFEL